MCIIFHKPNVIFFCPQKINKTCLKYICIFFFEFGTLKKNSQISCTFFNALKRQLSTNKKKSLINLHQQQQIQQQVQKLQQ